MRRALRWLLPTLALLWLVPRFLPGGSDLSTAVHATVAAFEVRPSARTGRFEIRGPSAAEDPTGLLGRPESVAARLRFQAAVDAETDDLSLFAREVAGRIERYEEEGVTGLRLSGMIVPFYDQDASRLADARGNAVPRPHASLQTIVEIVEVRLSEPDNGFSMDDATRRRELTRLSRDTRARLEDAGIRVYAAGERFRNELLSTARQAEGPFRRRGPGRVIEIVLAAALGAALMLTLRPPRRDSDAALTLAVTPALVTAAVLTVEGTPWLPVDALAGTAPRFVAFSLLLGMAIPVLWRAATATGAPKAPGMQKAPVEPKAAGAPKTRTPEAAPAPEAAPITPPVVAQRAVLSEPFFSAPTPREMPVTRRLDPTRPAPSRLPFARKRRRP